MFSGPVKMSKKDEILRELENKTYKFNAYNTTL